MNRIDGLFSRLRSENRRALMPFLTAGDPDLATTAALVHEVVKCGAHMVELGIPYSDPVADGPVISASYTRALRKGIRFSEILRTIRTLRAETAQGSLAAAPIVTMMSYAIALRHGLEATVDDANISGVDGLIVPDLPVEESEALATLLGKRDMKLIQLVTPTTPRDRARRILEHTTGFVYYVSVAGITGERKELPPELADNVAWLRTQTELPICIGFGISRPDQIRQLAPIADGLIVGSAIVRRLTELGEASRAEIVKNIGAFVSDLAAALPG